MKTAFVKGFYKAAKVLDTSEVTDYIHRPDQNIKDQNFSPEKFEPCRIGPDHRERATANTIESAELIKSARKDSKIGKFFEGFFGRLEESDKPARYFWPKGMDAPTQSLGAPTMYSRGWDTNSDLHMNRHII
jgi:hypothetical protein